MLHCLEIKYILTHSRIFFRFCCAWTMAEIVEAMAPTLLDVSCMVSMAPSISADVRFSFCIIVKLYLLIGFHPTGQSARKDSVLLVQLTLCLPIVVQTHDAFPELFRVSRGFFGHLLCTSLSNVSLSE